MPQAIPQLPPDLLALLGHLLGLGATAQGGVHGPAEQGFPEMLQGEIDALTESERAALLASLGVVTGGESWRPGGTALPPELMRAATGVPGEGVASPPGAPFGSQTGAAARADGLVLADPMGAIGTGVMVAAGGGEGLAGGGSGDRAGPDLLALWAQQRNGGALGPAAAPAGGIAETLDGSPSRDAGEPWTLAQGRLGPGTGSPLSTLARDLPGTLTWALTPQVGSSAWKGEMAQRVAWLAGREMHRAELRLNPPELGPLKVSISVSRDEASIVFGSHQGVVRDAVEAALPRLREMLEASGLNLVQVDISHREPDHSPPQGGAQGGFAGGAGAPGEEGDPGLPEGTPASRPRLGLVDAYV